MTKHFPKKSGGERLPHTKNKYLAENDKTFFGKMKHLLKKHEKSNILQKNDKTFFEQKNQLENTKIKKQGCSGFRCGSISDNKILSRPYFGAKTGRKRNHNIT